MQCQPLVTFLLLLVKLSKRYWSLGISSCLFCSRAEMQQGVRKCQFLNHHWAQLKFVLLRSKCTLAGGQRVVKDKYTQTNLLFKQEIPHWYRQKLFWTPLSCFSTPVTLLSKTFSRQCWVLSVRQKVTSYGTGSCQFFTPQKDTTLGKSHSAAPRWIRSSHFSEQSALPLTVLISLS